MSGETPHTGRTGTATLAPAPLLAARVKLRGVATDAVYHGERVQRWWKAQPERAVLHQANFYRRRGETHLGVAGCEYACVTEVRGVRCRRPAIPETKMHRCVKHAGPFAAARYRARRQRDVGDGKLSIEQWEAEEHRRTRTAITNRQRRRAEGWLLSGITLRLTQTLEDRFQRDLAPWLDRSWEDVPDHYRDRFRWAWRRLMLDHTAPDAWTAKAVSIRADLRQRGAYRPELVDHDRGEAPHVLICERKAPAWSWRAKPPKAEAAVHLLAWLPAARAVAASPPGRRPRPILPGADEVARLLTLHGRDLRAVLTKLPETIWPLMLLAWDQYVENPTLATHKRWLALAQGA